MQVVPSVERKTHSVKEAEMFSKEELKELATCRSQETPVLSAYLNVDSTEVTAEQYRLTLRGMLKSVADKADPADVEAIERYVELEYDRRGNGLAMFSAGDYWRVYPLAFAVGNSIHVGSQPYIKPLADYADAYDRYGVVLVDREGARLFMFNQGSLQEATGTLGEEIKSQLSGATGRGGRSGAGTGQGRSSGLDSKIDQIATRNLREVVDLTQRFYKAGQCERIILGGTHENLARFTSMLPKTLQSKVIGDVSIDMYASELEVLQRSMPIIQASIAERKAALVENVITAAHKESGSVGLADTLIAIQERRVQTLVIQEGFHAPGYHCTHCDYLSLRESDECSVCGGPAERLEDIVEHLVHRAISMDVEVAFVENEALEQAGSIGSLWRF
jgi:peptide chain release factor subunit 1